MALGNVAPQAENKIYLYNQEWECPILQHYWANAIPTSNLVTS